MNSEMTVMLPNLNRREETTSPGEEPSCEATISRCLEAVSFATHPMVFYTDEPVEKVISLCHETQKKGNFTRVEIGWLVEMELSGRGTVDELIEVWKRSRNVHQLPGLLNLWLCSLASKYGEDVEEITRTVARFQRENKTSSWVGCELVATSLRCNRGFHEVASIFLQARSTYKKERAEELAVLCGTSIATDIPFERVVALYERYTGRLNPFPFHDIMAFDSILNGYLPRGPVRTVWVDMSDNEILAHQSDQERSTNGFFLEGTWVLTLTEWSMPSYDFRYEWGALRIECPYDVMQELYEVAEDEKRRRRAVVNTVSTS